MAGLVEGKVVLVTGTGSGIGRASALAFAREGARVVASDLDVASGEETVRLVRQAGGEATFVAANVALPADVEALVAAVVTRYGRLDCAHNNAGIDSGAAGATHEHSEEIWDRVIGVNLKGTWLCMKYEVPAMLATGGGAIVNTASIAGLVASVGFGSAYTASKHGVVGITKVAALEYGKLGIRVNALCPGPIRTPMVDRAIAADATYEARVIAAEPMGRFGQPEEAAEAAVWLCSDAASFVTGHPMVVDGGYVAR